MKDDRILILLSGGLDSTVAMAWGKARGYNSIPVSFRYGQRHEKELESAEKVAKFFGEELFVFDLRPIFSDLSGCLIDGSPIPQGMTYDELKGASGIAPTYVPFRNGIFLSVATAFAYNQGILRVCYAAHATDARGGAYPDCTPAFTQAMKDTIYYGTGSNVDLLTPFITKTKGEVLEDGLKLEAPIHLTWSCYLGGERPCGECPTCLERAEAFRYTGTTDPLLEE